MEIMLLLGKMQRGLGNMGVFVQTVMIKITQLLENSIRLWTFNELYTGTRQGHHELGLVLGCPTGFRADAWAEVGLMATLVDIHTSGWHGSAWANSVLHPWSEIVESGFSLVLDALFGWVVPYSLPLFS
jgi:hypothetical protein